MVFYFSATGNCLDVARRIAGELGTIAVSIPQAMRDPRPLYEDDVIGVVFPIYSSRPPRMVKDFLASTTLKADYTFAIATYGFSTGNPFKRLIRRLRRPQSSVRSAGRQFRTPERGWSPAPCERVWIARGGYLKISSWVPVLWKTARSSVVYQTKSQSPALQT